jgi:PKHD-type hydroxylase
MILTIPNLLGAEELATLCDRLANAEFVDGKLTAGWHAQLVKHNTQLKSDDPQLENLCSLVKATLNKHPLFQTAVQPNIIHKILFSRYDVGMSYGLHVDNAMMASNHRRYRSDISWTIFLSDPTTYAGGELIIEGSEGIQEFKLEVGSIVLYPSSFLHRVEPVTEGVRLAAVGWVQSLIRDPAQRDLLFDLDVVRRSLFQKDGKTTEFDLISKTYANLLRQWAEF